MLQFGRSIRRRIEKGRKMLYNQKNQYTAIFKCVDSNETWKLIGNCVMLKLEFIDANNNNKNPQKIDTTRVKLYIVWEVKMEPINVYYVRRNLLRHFHHLSKRYCVDLFPFILFIQSDNISPLSHCSWNKWIKPIEIRGVTYANKWKCFCLKCQWMCLRCEPNRKIDIFPSLSLCFSPIWPMRVHIPHHFECFGMVCMWLCVTL